jgi:MFS transporter, AAHS family, 4-hydroxybenzoate transporter
MRGSELPGLLDRVPISTSQIMVGLLCALVAVMDGFDTQAIGYVAPAIVQSWKISKVALGPVFSAGLIGALLGALSFSPLADRFGRKPILILCSIVFGCGALATAAADSLSTLLVLRFLTGLGMGGAMPIAIAQTSEFMPARARTLAVTLTYCGFSLGAALGGMAADQLIERFSWQAVFVAGGIPILLLALTMTLWLPESISFLLSHQITRKQGEDALRKLGVDPNEIPLGSRPETRLAPTAAVAKLFAEGRTAQTLAIWVIVFMNLMELYFFTSWLPTVVHSAGLTIGRAALVTALFQAGGTVGALIISKLLDRFRKFRVLGCIYIGAAVFVTTVGYLLASGAALSALITIQIAVALAGVCIVGGQIGTIAATATLYPTAIRSSAVGWALGMGRLGSVIGPFIGSALISAGLGNFELFLIGALPVSIAAAVALWLDTAVLRPSRPGEPVPAGMPPL